MNNGELFEIKCPAEVTTKKGYTIRCDHLCCIAAKGSTVRIKCRHCKTIFEAVIPESATKNEQILYRIVE